MHSVELNPKPVEVFQGVGRLIIEGRIPGLNIKRGFGEGPHCLNPFQTNGKLHTCTPHDPVCVRDQSLRKQVSLLWDNGIPLCIEVLLCSECPCGKEKANSVEISTLPEPSDHLLEKWIITATRRSRDSLGSCNGGQTLLQVVRSYLHFSQLASSLSKSDGKIPSNILYRVTMPGETFASKFSVKPQAHKFPLAFIQDRQIEVTVKSIPRSEDFPLIECTNINCPDKACLTGLPPVVLQLDETPTRPNNNARESKAAKRCTRLCPDRTPPVRSGLIEDEFPTHCTISGKHCCSEDETEDEDEVQVQNVKPKVVAVQSKHVSRRDLFLESLAFRTKTRLFHEKEAPAPKPIELDLDSSLDDDPESSLSSTDDESDDVSISRLIPTHNDKIQFRKSLNSAASMVFHGKTGLPLTSSPAPLRKGQDRFDFDSELTAPAKVQPAVKGSHLRGSSGASQLLGSFEESVLRGRLEPVSTVQGFTAELGASGSFCPKHMRLPVTVFFYTFRDNDAVSAPYLAHINMGNKGYEVPRVGTVQVTLSNPNQTVVKMFVILYDFKDMPPRSRTFLRQRILYMPLGSSDNDPDAQKWLRYLIHLRFASNSSGKIYLHTDMRIVVFRKSDADTATGHGLAKHELRSFTHAPVNPKYSPRMAKPKNRRRTRKLNSRK